MALSDLINEVEAELTQQDQPQARSVTDVLSSSQPIPDTGNDPILRGLLTAQKEIVGPAVQGINTALLGIPKFAATKLNPQAAMEIFAEQSSTPGKVARIGAEAAGLIGGGAGKIGLATAKATSKGLTKALGTSNLASKFTSNLLSGATSGAAAGAAQITDPEASYKELVKRQAVQAGGGALGGAALGALFPIFRGIKNFKYATDDDVAAGLMKSMRKEFTSVKGNEVSKFGRRITELSDNHPNRAVDLNDFMDNFKANMEDMPAEARNAIRKVPLIKKLLMSKNPADPYRVTLKEIQDAKNYINTKIPATVRANYLDVVEAADDLSAAQLEAFPEMAAVRAEYQKVIEPYNMVKNYFKANRLFNAIDNGFGGPEGRAAVKQLLSENTINKMGGVRAAQKLVSGSGELIRNLVIGISSGVGAGAVFRTLNKDE